MTPAEVTEFQGLLAAARLSVSSAINKLHDVGGATSADEGGPGEVRVDGAATTFDRELDEGLEEDALLRLAAIDRALARLADGSFGTCERCGRPIGDERLHARPWATLCIDDQRLADRG